MPTTTLFVTLIDRETLVNAMEKANPDVEIHEREPEGFSPQVQVAACYLEIDGKLLVLQSAAGALESGRWGVPAGKLEKNETPESAARRELFEETGIEALSDDLKAL
jgi:uncharacterized protein